MKVYTCCIYTPFSKIIHCVKSYDYYIIFMLDIVQCDYTRVIMKMALFGKIVHGPFCIKKSHSKKENIPNLSFNKNKNYGVLKVFQKPL